MAHQIPKLLIETLTYRDDARQRHSVEYIGKDGPHRALVLHNGNRMTYFTYKLYR